MPLFNLSATNINQQIRNGGPQYAKHWLTMQDDPLVFQYQGNGAEAGYRSIFYAESVVNEDGLQQHLTYGIMENVVKGLDDWMQQGHHWFGVRFEVEEGRWGLVGRGLVLPGELPATGVVNASEPGELEWFRGLNMTALVMALAQK